MMDTFERLRSLVTPDLLARCFSKQVDCDEVLDDRDLPEFEENWLRVYTQLEQMKSRSPLGEGKKQLLDQVREDVYKGVFSLTEAPEVAGAVSDDFGLICTAALVDFSDDWLNALWAAYRDGTIPTSQLDPIPGSLGDLVP